MNDYLFSMKLYKFLPSLIYTYFFCDSSSFQFFSIIHVMVIYFFSTITSTSTSLMMTLQLLLLSVWQLPLLMWVYFMLSWIIEGLNVQLESSFIKKILLSVKQYFVCVYECMIVLEKWKRDDNKIFRIIILPDFFYVVQWFVS